MPVVQTVARRGETATRSGEGLAAVPSAQNAEVKGEWKLSFPGREEKYQKLLQIPPEIGSAKMFEPKVSARASLRPIVLVPYQHTETFSQEASGREQLSVLFNTQRSLSYLCQAGFVKFGVEGPPVTEAIAKVPERYLPKGVPETEAQFAECFRELRRVVGDEGDVVPNMFASALAEGAQICGANSGEHTEEIIPFLEAARKEHSGTQVQIAKLLQGGYSFVNSPKWGLVLQTSSGDYKAQSVMNSVREILSANERYCGIQEKRERFALEDVDAEVLVYGMDHIESLRNQALASGRAVYEVYPKGVGKVEGRCLDMSPHIAALRELYQQYQAEVGAGSRSTGPRK